MNRKNIFLGLMLSAALLTSLLFSGTAYASDFSTTKDIPIGGSGQMEMVGMIEPTILSVTLPTFVPFNISGSIPAENKVISPRVTMINNSNIPVRIDVVYAKVDLSNLSGNTFWNNTGAVGANEIAIGLKPEEVKDQMPGDLSNTRWLQANQEQNSNILLLNGLEEGAVYVVGTLGQDVSENGTFNVTPTFVVRRAAANEP